MMSAKIEKWIPGLKLFRTYKREWLSHDMIAGVSVAAVALPIGIAYAQLAGASVTRLPLAGDDTALLKQQIIAAAESSDVVVSSGGVSVGVYDFTKPALKEMGAELFFERVCKPRLGWWR